MYLLKGALKGALKGLVLCSLLGLVGGCVPGADTMDLASGKTLDRNELRGKWVLINYWAEWCKPCVTEIPEFNRLTRQGDPDLRVLGANYDGVEGQALLKQIAHMQIAFDVFASDPAPRLGFERPRVLPTTYILDRQGRVARILLGPQTLEGINRALAELRRGNITLNEY